MNRLSGFTLIELVLVAALIGLIAMIAVPSVPSADIEQRARAESFLLETFRTARQEAMRTGATCGVTIDISNQRVLVHRYDA
ncbi:MAG: type II secretion system protein, partial [Rhodocyclaceae bacterium]|nr:type II secretion system protein [Rhodocyclaceae bacterium]